MGLIVALLVIVGSVNLSFASNYAMDIDKMFPQDGTKPIWSRLYETAEFSAYYLTNFPHKYINQNNGKTAFVKYVYRKPMKLNKIKLSPGAYTYFMLWIAPDNKVWSVMARETFDANGKMIENYACIHGETEDPDLQYVETGDVAYRLIYEQKY